MSTPQIRLTRHMTYGGVSEISKALPPLASITDLKGKLVEHFGVSGRVTVDMEPDATGILVTIKDAPPEAQPG